jgi:hypothetical protein
MEEATRIADTLEPLAKKIGQSYSIALCFDTRAWVEFGKAPDLAKLEGSLQQFLKSDQTAQFAFWAVSTEAQLSLVAFYRGNWAGALLHAQASCRAEPGSSSEGLGIGTLFDRWLTQVIAPARSQALMKSAGGCRVSVKGIPEAHGRCSRL